MTVHLWAIGGCYTAGDGRPVKLKALTDHMALVEGTDFEIWADKDFVSGPTHLPCPYCGELQIVNSESGLAAMRGEGQIDFPEHMMRCRL